MMVIGKQKSFHLVNYIHMNMQEDAYFILKIYLKKVHE